jgi:hypothetical protein
MGQISNLSLRDDEGFGDGASTFGFVDSGFLGDVDCSLAAGEVFTEALWKSPPTQHQLLPLTEQSQRRV